jgi:flagellar basal-body rod protein FlgF
VIQGVYAAANGMLAVEERQAVIANNIANASTPGFKRQLAVQKGYHEAFYLDGRRPERFDKIVAPGGGIRTIETFSNFGNGVVSTTSNPLDIALAGPGFLKVEGQDGTRFTRNGRMAIADDKLITLTGETVLSEDDNPIDVSGGMVEFDAQGFVYVNGESRGRLGLVEFEDPHALTREGNTLFRAPQDVIDAAQPAVNTSLLPQSIEASNVELPAEMINMMTALRAYAANQQVIQSVNETVSRMINQVGGL